MPERLQSPRDNPFALLLFAALLCAAPARGSAADRQPADGDWSFVVSPYAWLLSVDGDARYRGTKAEIDQSFSDIVGKMDVVLEGRLEARKGDWTLFLDPTISRLSDEAEVGPIDVDIDTTLALVGLGVSRTLYRGPRSPGSSRSLTLEAGLGAILTRAKSEIDLPSPASDPDLEETWVDAALSVRGTTEINDLWRVRSTFLIGGFGIGESSELSLGFDVLFGRRLSETRILWLGYRALSIDLERGSGVNKRDLELVMHGPVIGVSFLF